MDRLGQSSTTIPPPVSSTIQADRLSGQSLDPAAVSCSEAADTSDVVCDAQESPAAKDAAQLEKSAPTTDHDLAQLAAELKVLAEETDRLKHGLDRLLELTETASHHPNSSASCHGWFTNRERFARGGANGNTRPPVSTVGAGEAGGRALWLQERLLGAVEALLEEVRAGGLLSGLPVGGGGWR